MEHLNTSSENQTGECCIPACTTQLPGGSNLQLVLIGVEGKGASQELCQLWQVPNAMWHPQHSSQALASLHQDAGLQMGPSVTKGTCCLTD